MFTVRVWDLPTRFFHWSLVLLITVSWFTGEEEGLASLIHRLSGEAIVGLLIFRFIWGFIGGEYSRFAKFFSSPGDIAQHIRELIRAKATPTLGHNALGALASIALMLIVALTAFTGLFSAGDDRTGPLFALFNVNLKEVHEVSFRLLQAMVVLHLVGVAVTSYASRDNLIRAMVTGKKVRAQGPAVDAKPATSRALLTAVAISLVVAGGLMLLPHPPGEGEIAAQTHSD